MSKADKYRGRLHMILLYPDNDDHLNALLTLEKSYDYAGIRHNKDLWTEEDEKKDSNHKSGTFKKEHIHIVLRTQNAVWNTALANDLGIDERFIEKARGLDYALQYLIHYNDTDKAEYSIDEVFGSLKTKLQESLTKREKSEGEKVGELISYIESQNNYLTVKSFAQYCALNGYWAEFRRSASIFIKILEEHNLQFKIEPQKPCSAYDKEIDKARFEGFIQGDQVRLGD